MVDVSIMLVRALVTAVERAGFDRAEFLVAAGLEGVHLDDVLGRISFEDYQRVVRAAYGTAGDPAFGLHVGERLALGAFDVLGHLTEHSPSLRDAITTVLRYSRFVSNGPRLAFEERSESATLCIVLPENETLAALLAAEFSTVGMLRLLRSFVGDHALATRAFFAHNKPAHAAEYTRIFGGCELFGCDATGLEFPRTWLDYTPACRASDLHGFLLQRAELLLAKAERSVAQSERVRRWLAAQPDLSRPTLELVSRGLGLSARTLRRHLQDENVQFTALVDESRAAHAKRTLADPAQPIHEAAYTLGFRTPSAFSRAFKRWTGMTPRDYRNMRG